MSSKGPFHPSRTLSQLRRLLHISYSYNHAPRSHCFHFFRVMESRFTAPALTNLDEFSDCLWQIYDVNIPLITEIHFLTLLKSDNYSSRFRLGTYNPSPRPLFRSTEPFCIVNTLSLQFFYTTLITRIHPHFFFTAFPRWYKFWSSHIQSSSVYTVLLLLYTVYCHPFFGVRLSSVSCTPRGSQQHLSARIEHPFVPFKTVLEFF